MNKTLLVQMQRIVWYVFWGVFVNALSVWVFGPLVKDLAMYGVLALGFIAVIWLTTIRKAKRKSWISYTLLSLLLAQGLSALTYTSLEKTVLVTVVMSLGLFIIGLWFARIHWLPLLAGTVGIIVANLILPFSDWPFLTQFGIVQQSRVSINPSDMAAAPFDVIHTSTGDAIITLSSYIPSSALLQQLTSQATDSPDALANVLQASQGEYEFVELKMVNGKVVKETPTPEDLAKVNPLQLVRSFFPYQLGHWYAVNGQVSEYLTPYLSSDQAVEVGVNPATYATSLQALSNEAVQTELANWDQVLTQLGVQPQNDGLVVENGLLTGSFGGHTISIPVQASSFVGVGHFTSTTSSQALLVGDNDLQVVDLSQRRVVATFKGTAATPIPNDVVFGPLTSGGRDAVFVNASPAYVLSIDHAGQWHQVYKATSSSFRFETVMTNGNGTPQIITDDPSMVRNTPTRYFSAYRYVPDGGVSGHLVRDWRVFRTNVVDVTPITMSTGGSKDIAVGIYGSGEYLILHKSNVPVLPMSCVAFAIILVCGWVLRWKRGKERDAE